MSLVWFLVVSYAQDLVLLLLDFFGFEGALGLEVVFVFVSGFWEEDYYRLLFLAVDVVVAQLFYFS